MKLGVVINAGAGRGADGDLSERLNSALHPLSLHASVAFAGMDEIESKTSDLLKQGCDAIAAGGGDGTLSAVADICVHNGIPLGVLPLGTHNHFARDARLPLQLDEGLACIAAGHTRKVDVGSVNDRCFLNNSSIGAYPWAVQERHELQNRYALKKHVAAIIATLRVFARKPEIDATIHVDGRTLHRRSPFVFVGNNPYSIQMFAPRFRETLNSGELCLCTASVTGLGAFFRLLWLAARGSLEQKRDFEMVMGKHVVIQLKRDDVRVSMDGEVKRMQTPLEYHSIPGALEVFSPVS